MVRKSPRTTKVRDVLVKLESIGRILKVHQIQRGIEVPIIELTHFLVCTGARLGEALHAEWQDFDLVKGIWRIIPKPECPTSYGLGWYLKYKKPRVIELIPEVGRILQYLPRH